MVTKEDIIDKIQKIDDESILEDLMDLINLELDLTGEIVKLDEFQKTAIDQGLNDLKEGKVLSNEQAQKMLGEWMSKR